MPYTQEINDKPVFERQHRTADEFRDIICRRFDVPYREGAQSGRVMAMGVPAALAHICRHEGVWKSTGADIARHYAAAQAKQ
jgi:allantoinase